MEKQVELLCSADEQLEVAGYALIICMHLICIWEICEKHLQEEAHEVEAARAKPI